MNTLFSDRPGQTLSLEEFQDYLSGSELSLESLYEVSNEGLIETVKSFIPTAVRTLFGVVKDLPQDDITILKRDQFKFLNQLKKKDFTDFRQLNLTVPAGMKVDYLTFLTEFIVPSVMFLDKHFTKELKDFTQYTGGLVNKPEDRLKSLEKVQVNHIKEIDDIKANLGKYIMPNSPLTTAPYQKAFQRNKDWEKVLTVLFDCSYRLNKMSPKQLNKQMQTAQSHLSKFNQWLDKDINGQKVTPESIRMMADYALSMAKQAELYALIHYYLKVLNTAMENNIQVVSSNMN